jgi:hypothetical protein
MDETAAVIRSFAALLDAEDEVAHSFLLGALYVIAVVNEDSPRNVLEALFKALPDDETWPSLRDALLACMNC